MLRRTVALLLTLAVAAGWVACGDDDDPGGSNNANTNENTNANANTNDNANQNNNAPPSLTIADLEGFHLVEELSVSDEEGEGNPLVLTRDEAVVTMQDGTHLGMVRGYLEVTADTTTEGTALLHTGVIFERMLYIHQSLDLAVTLEPEDGKLLLQIDGTADVRVYDYDLNVDVLTLTLDLTDVRNTSEDLPEGLVSRIMTPTVTEVSGQWLVNRWTWITNPMVQPPGTMTFTAACEPLPPEMGYPFGSLSGTFDLAPEGTLQARWLLRVFDVADCSGAPTDEDEILWFGFYDVDPTAHTVKAYLEQQTSPTESMVYGYDWDYSFDATGLTLTTTEAYYLGPFGLYTTEIALTAP